MGYMRIQCRTTFDITETRITGQYKSQSLPLTDQVGTVINDYTAWIKARNQQRNFETISQILQLRTQIFDLTIPVVSKGYWSFECTVEFEGIYQQGQDLFGILKQDCEDVPMIIGLDDEYILTPFLITSGSQQNIWFEEVLVNT